MDLFAPVTKLIEARKLAEAEMVCRRLIAETNQHSDGLHLLGVIKYKTEHLEEALELTRQAIARAPSMPGYYANLAIYLRDSGQFAEAEASCRQALLIDSRHTGAHTNLAEILLMQERYREGFAYNEFRPLDFELPAALRWQGGAANGRLLLLMTEQGRGDAFQFLRFVSLVRKGGYGTAIGCRYPELRNLLQFNFPESQIVIFGETLPAYDAWYPVMSLPHAFPGVLPLPPYLAADPARIGRYRTRLEGESRLKVGLVWAGSRTFAHDIQRSIPFAQLGPLWEQRHVAFYSLQVGEAGREGRDAPLTDFTSELVDFSETAALIECLDLVITVDSAVVHLAGAMGKKVWVTLPHAPDWRWLRDRPDSPWYPSARLFRQPKRGDWASVIREISEALSQLAS